MKKKFIRKDETCLYAMAKEAYHKLGDVSRDDWDLIQIFEEDEENYYGNWMYGFGLIDVRFPKKNVKQLNKKEIKKYDNSGIAISGSRFPNLKIKDRLWKKP
jgi:hypothetical protein